MGRRKRNIQSRGDRSALIINLFREMPNKHFSLKHLAAATGDASKQGKQETFEILCNLYDEGVIEECARGKYRLTTRHLPRYEGVASMNSTGAVFVRVEGFDSDIYVNPRNAANALDGDIVEVVVMNRGGSRGRIEGEIACVRERSKRPYVGVAQVGAHQIFVRPVSNRLPMDIFLPKKAYPDVKEGDKVSVRIVDWAEGSRSPVGELVEIFGTEGDNDTEMHAILAEYDLPYTFPPEVLAEAEAIEGCITESEIARRRDFRDRLTFTIDPADAKDFDDALSIRRLGDDLWEVGVHIADVTHYVRPGSLIDEEACARGTSVYLVDRTVPMLPERLSNELCSLRPNETSLCFSAVFVLNGEGEIQNEWFGRTVIHSDRRFDYGEAQQVIDTGTGDCAEEMLTLHRMAQKLRHKRFRDGSIAFERAEMKFRLDEAGKPIGVYTKEQTEANHLIEEFMLLANRRVAEFCGRRLTEKGRYVARTMVYRIHDVPDPEKLDRFRQFVLRFGHFVKASKGKNLAREMNQLMDRVKGSVEADAITTLAVRAMAKACYSTENIGHYGLAFPFYTHFTSPIRRYPDMLVHRLLAHYLAGGKSADREELEGLCTHASEREVIAAEAERESIKYKAAEFMQDRVGEEFDAHISGITGRGAFVELEETHIEGLVHLRDIAGDYFSYDDDEYELVGRNTGLRLTLGDAVRARVKSVDLHKRQLDFELFPAYPERKKSDWCWDDLN